jgi:hypothetical protein
MGNNVICLLNQSRDISLVKLIKRISPVPLTIIVTNVTSVDEYGWSKRKNLQQCINNEEILSLQNEIDDVIVCRDIPTLKEYLSDCEVCLSRGREFFVLKEIAKRNVALSLNRCYFNRLLDVLPHYKNLKVMFNSDRWLEEKYCGNFAMDKHNYGQVDKYKDSFRGVDIMGYNYQHMVEQGKIDIKRKLKVPLDSKIAFVSFRMAQKDFSIYKDADAFIDTTKREIERLKAENYYIISTRRLGKHDMEYYKATNAPDITRFSEIEHLVDIEMNDSNGFPGTIWDALYASDLLLLSDISGICHYEAALCRCPIYMPYDKIDNINKLNPATRDMFNRGLIFNDLSKIEYYQDEVENFVKDWYNTDVDLFWEEVLND